jgi:DNA-binding CsgD family transcriptional regulator
VQKALTQREEQVFELADSGCSNKVIAGSLGISTSAVATLLGRARRKTHDCARASQCPGPSETVAPPPRIDEATRAPRSRSRARAAFALTSAEKAVIELALTGMSNAAIAEKRRCTARTVANQLTSAYQKLGIASRRELHARKVREVSRRKKIDRV